DREDGVWGKSVKLRGGRVIKKKECLQGRTDERGRQSLELRHPTPDIGAFGLEFLPLQHRIENPDIVFFQAEDGIRDWSVTGVQTCALPICSTFPGLRSTSKSDMRAARKFIW